MQKYEFHGTNHEKFLFSFYIVERFSVLYLKMVKKKIVIILNLNYSFYLCNTKKKSKYNH